MIKKVVKEKKFVSCRYMCLFCLKKKCRYKKKYLKRLDLIYCRNFESCDERVVFYDDVSKKNSILKKIVDELC